MHIKEQHPSLLDNKLVSTNFNRNRGESPARVLRGGLIVHRDP